MKWRPIEKAPKDGSLFLAYARNDGENLFDVALWVVADSENCLHEDRFEWCYLQEPTHWMPLPEPPTAET